VRDVIKFGGGGCGAAPLFNLREGIGSLFLLHATHSNGCKGKRPGKRENLTGREGKIDLRQTAMGDVRDKLTLV
jgi:hypothetical protein